MALGHVTNVVAMAVTVAMLVGCLYCARDLWLRGTIHGWLTVALMNFAMIAIHLPASAVHHHGRAWPRSHTIHESTGDGRRDRARCGRGDDAAVVLYYRTRAMGPVESSLIN